MFKLLIWIGIVAFVLAGLVYSPNWQLKLTAIFAAAINYLVFLSQGG